MEARPYSVKLDCHGPCPPSERIAAEVRFISALERALGGPSTVAAAYRAWITASEAQANEIDREAAELACRWPSAYRAAATKGLAGVQGVEEPTFAIRLH